MARDPEIRGLRSILALLPECRVMQLLLALGHGEGLSASSTETIVLISENLWVPSVALQRTVPDGSARQDRTSSLRDGESGHEWTVPAGT
jgi:hypothetical protein